MRAKHLLHHHQPRPDQKPRHNKNNTDRSHDPETVCRDPAVPCGGVEEIIRVESLHSIRDIRDSEIASQEQDQEQQMDPWWTLSACEDDLEECENRV